MLARNLFMNNIKQDLSQATSSLKKLEANLQEFSRKLSYKSFQLSRLNRRIAKFASGSISFDDDNIIDRILNFFDDSYTYMHRRQINAGVLSIENEVYDLVNNYNALFQAKERTLVTINASKITFKSLTPRDPLALPDCSVNNLTWSKELLSLTYHLDLYLELIANQIQQYEQYLKTLRPS